MILAGRFRLPVHGAGAGNALNGNVIGFTDLVQGSGASSYDNVNHDNMNRMTSVTPAAGPYDGLAFSWAYDPFGNRKSQTVSGSSSQPIQSTPTFTFTASATNHVDNGSYDSMGNLLADQLNHYAYDAEGRLCAAAPISGGATGYLYDAEGQRWAKGSLSSLSCNYSSNGFAATSTYLLGPADEQLTELDGSGNWKHTNVFAGGGLLATYDSVGTHFALADWLGTKRIQASATGGIDETCLSLPFGDSLTCSGPAADATEHHFTGKERDVESGNDFFLARYLGSTTGRFLSPDYMGIGSDPVPVPSADFENPQSLNLYGYVHNSPLSNIDPDGHDCVVQTVRNPASESVSVTPGSCDSVKTGDGQSKTYIAGTVDTSSIQSNGTGGITFGYTSYTGGGGVADLKGSPYPNQPNLEMNFGNNAEGGQILVGADRLVTNVTIATAAVYGS